EILDAYPSAKVGLFQRYHIGGCASCGYQPRDTLQEVCATHDIADPLYAVIACIRESEVVEATLHIRPAQVAAALEGGDKLILLDVRAPEEWEAGHIEGAQLATVELTFEILDSWPKDTPLVLYSNHGNRSLDRASYFRAYGLTKPRSMDGGLEAWLALAGSAEEILRDLGKPFHTVDVLSSPEKRDAIKRFSKWPTIPQVYVNSKFIGGCDIVRELHQRGELQRIVEEAFEE